MSNDPSHRRMDRSADAFEQAFRDNLYYARGTTPQSASDLDVYQTLSLTVRDYLMERRRKTTEAHFAANPKFVYYLSAEYLLGRQLTQNMLYTGTWDLATQVAERNGLRLQDFVHLDHEPGLGNGGLGRLAACFLDSLATLDIPAVGYGIRYEYGIFEQAFQDGWQVESPDTWLYYGTPWEFAQPDDMVEIGFGGRTERYRDEQGRQRTRWIPGETVMGEPNYMLVPGYETETVNILRLWRARATREFDFELFDKGDYERAVEGKVFSENITKVLYPNDTTPQGKELRLRQQYFFVAASLRDIIRRFRFHNSDWASFPDKVAIQLNDTHPVVGIPELMRILVDEAGVSWDEAWDITRRCFAYTCHTLMPEALEEWPVSLFERLLPRHLEIIYEINAVFLKQVAARFPGEAGRIAAMSIIGEGSERRVRMAHLATVGSFSVNGVAALQSRLLAELTLRDFAELWPKKFNNKTNGVTPRRFMRLGNPRLCALIDAKLGPGWLNDLERLRGLDAFVDDPTFRAAWREVKQQNKAELAALIKRYTGIEVDTNTIFDVMVKRLHEYKRQLLKALHIITLYQRIKADPAIDMPARTFIFGAKAAPGYKMAKLIIKLINNVAEVVNNDPDVAGRLTVVFIPNFNVSKGERIYPGADISEQISMAGKEASGTGNMKFALNGALTVGTLDGANVEIRELVGAENFYLFGLHTEEVMALKASGYNPLEYYSANAELKRAIDAIATGVFSSGNRDLFQPIVASLLTRDDFLLLADYADYVRASEQAAHDYYADPDGWTRMSILNSARCGFFSSDRSMRQYCAEIWRVEPVRVSEAK
ncbi:MAG TPA: glycogen/starch/alpha-glucan phosphorylase [Anaerolineae bacterium]|nr:glycogen/starch/alpha-glucan phosphorylase [Anaerolineae bacterium]